MPAAIDCRFLTLRQEPWEVAEDMEPAGSIRLSQDAAIVLGLAGTAVMFAHSREDEAERWVRVMRLHGRVGQAMQALGVGEAPLETPATEPPAKSALRREKSRPTIADIESGALEFAAARGSQLVTTVDVLFAAIEAYGASLDRALRRRGTTCEELIDELAEESSGGCQGGAPDARARRA